MAYTDKPSPTVEVHYDGRYIKAVIMHLEMISNGGRPPEVQVRGIVVEDALELHGEYQHRDRLRRGGAVAPKINKKFYIAAPAIIDSATQELGVESWPKVTLEEVITQATAMVNDKNGPDTVAIVQIIRTVSRQPTPVKIKKI